MFCTCHKKMRKNGKLKGKQRWRCVHCGYNFTENSRELLKEKDIQTILSLSNKGSTVSAIAVSFNTSRAGIYYHLKKNL